MASSQQDRERLYVLRVIDGKPWKEIYPLFSHIPQATQRRIVSKERKRRGGHTKANATSPPKEEKTEYTEDGNRAFLVNVSRNIRTEAQMLDAIEADLTKWRKTRWSARVWQQQSKLNIDGQWKLVKDDLWYSRIDFLPIEPVAVMPAVQPIQITSKRRTGKKGRIVRDIQKALILPDPQFGFRREFQSGHLDPFHDRRALDVALQIAHVEQPDKIVWLGDMLDLAEWSDRFIRSPEFYWSTQPALIEAAWWLAQFRKAVPEAEIIVMEGNHDKRLETSLLVHLAAAYQLRPVDELEMPPAMTIPRLLALDGMDIRYVGDYPNGEEWLNDTVVCVHGSVVRQPGQTAAARAREIDVTEIHGHIHRREWAARTIHGRRDRRIVEAFSPGCLCRIDGAVPGKKAKAQWQQGIALVRYTKKHYSISPIAIDEGRALAEGALYTAQERLADLTADTDWKF